MRQVIDHDNDPQRGVSIATHSHEYARGFRVPLHAHQSNQLVYASRGVMEVTSNRCVWTIPPHFGLWIPARTPHEIHMPERVSMRTLYLRPSLTRLASACAVLHIGSLLRELIFEIVRVGQLHNRDRIECALRDLLVAELLRATPVPAVVVLPKDSRAVAVAQALIADPAMHNSMQALCAAAGLSVRTMQRVFLREVGSNFACWRRQVRLMKAVELLVAGHSVKEAAFSVGYQQSSAFVALFRTTFGTTPKAWISALNHVN
jgi:AraC-like DNA-binding protein